MEIIMNWLGTIPGAVAQGLAWGLMAIGVYITFKILDVADLTVDGSICTGMAVCAVLITSGVNVWFAILCAMAAGMLARQGIAVRGGLDCAPLAHESAGTLETGTVRVSFGHDACPRQQTAFCRLLKECLQAN